MNFGQPNADIGQKTANGQLLRISNFTMLLNFILYFNSSQVGCLGTGKAHAALMIDCNMVAIAFKCMKVIFSYKDCNCIVTATLKKGHKCSNVCILRT